MTSHGLRYFFRSFCTFAVIALVTVSLGSCSAAKNQMTMDRPAGKELQDFRDALEPVPLPEETASGAPDFRPMVAVPSDMKLPSPLVTVSVNQTVSLRDLMFELSEQAGVDLELDPQIHGSIIFTAKDRPFNDVVDRICEMAGLSYKFQNNVLRVELDRPYVKNYKVDYMNVSRKSSSSINSNISVSGAGSDVSSSAGSSSSISNDSDSNFWRELDEGLRQVLTASDAYLSLATLADPVPTSSAMTMPLIDVNNPNAATTPPPLSSATSAPSLNVAQAEFVPPPPNQPATYAIAKETGVVSVFANERQHRLVKKFLGDLRAVSTVQVLIEAKVLEVGLTDEFSAGIDWGSVKLTGFANLSADFTSPTAGTGITAVFDLGKGNNVAPVIDALSHFGTVRALSSPRVTVMNNNPAVVNVSENKVYFTINASTTTIGSPPTTTTTYSTTQQSVPEGVLLNVVPSANAATGEIILAVRPTVSKKVGDVEDPTISLNGGSVVNLIPEMSVQEIDSVIKIQSGQTLVMGGLMRDQNNVNRNGVPLLGEVPLVGALFRNHDDTVRKSELVILLRAVIVPGGNADDQDRKIYKEFGLDRRPVRL
ncbi:MAG: type II and III secretion system family protein [Alphaproteobacteria bacterium]|nr:type II and III secretion system family protein [Alphaproteobacteria bacterium]